MRGSKHPALAKEFYEFVTTPEALHVAADKFVRMPARSDMSADSMPSWIREARAQIRPMPLIADSLDSWMKYWDAHVRNCCRVR